MNLFRLAAPILVAYIFLFSFSFKALALSGNEANAEIPTSQYVGEIQEQSPLNGSISQSTIDTNINAEDLQVLKTCDLAILIDQSTSMRGQDCSAPTSGNPIKKLIYGSNKVLAAVSSGIVTIPAGQSRWNYACNETINFCKSTSDAYPNGFTVSTFGLLGKNHNNVTPDTVESIFKNKIPFGGTFPAVAIGQTFKDYFKRRACSPAGTKPLLIVVLSDCGFDTGNRYESLHLRKEIESATQKMINNKEIILCFCRMGASIEGDACLQHLRVQLRSKKAKYDILHFANLAQLRSAGLAKTLAGVIREHICAFK